MAIQEVTVPELGEGIEEGDVVSVLVSEGDRVEKEQPIVEVESEKAAVEIPSPFSGLVKEIFVKAGERIKVGQKILRLETDAEQGEDAAEAEPAERGDEREAATGDEAEEPEIEAEAHGKKRDATGKRAQPDEAEEAPRESEEEDEPQAARPARDERVRQRRRGEEEEAVKRPAGEQRDEEAPGAVPAGPGVRRLARELGLDLRDIDGSGREGRITPEDVKNTVRRLISKKSARPEEEGEGETSRRVFSGEQPPFPDLSKWGEVTREPLGSLRRMATRTTGISWRLIPHVTQFDDADITELEEQREDLARALEEDGVKLTVTAIAIKAAALALRRFPRFNASLDEEAEEVVQRNYVHVGVAVDTERGLVVPVIRDADTKPLKEVAREVAELAEKARDKRLKPDEMAGGTFTVTNLGGLGTTYFTPIVTWPQVAVLGVGRAAVKPVFRDGDFAPRRILPLAISYDHRLIDGADAARFLRWIALSLEQPLRLLLEG